jgi:hypothetical protein
MPTTARTRSGYRRAVCQADELLMPQRGRQADDVSCQLENVVGFDGLGPVAATIAALVRNSDLKASFHHWVDLVTPKVPALRKAMEKNN